ncbi:kinase-like protein [Xylaria intraflava]|nr:kinase-like protein [Xylaria intraflava]
MDSSNDPAQSNDSTDDDIQRISRSAEERSRDRTRISLPGPEDAVSMERHRNMMLASLLEDHYRSRALEFLNATDPGKCYTRQSEEVEALTRQLFTQAGRVLSSNGLLSSRETSDESQRTRGQYLLGLDSLLVGSQAPDIMESMREVVTQTSQLHLTAHPTNDLQLTLRQPPRPRSHYRSSFREDFLIGKGGFGKVYQCYNYLDQKTYAVKKIILPPKIVKGLSDGRHDDLEHILREVKAMAMLDHPNVVRYHATWFEEPEQLPDLRDGIKSTKDQPERRNQQLLLDSHAFDEGSEQELSFTGGIVFGEDTPSRPSAAANTSGVNRINQGWSEADISAPDIANTTSVLDSDVFTGGITDRENSDSYQTTVDTKVHALYIQMSVYPMTLARFISPSPPANVELRHCFHLAPTLRLMLSIHNGLQYIHSKGLIHRDIKPGNIFLSSPSAVFEGGYCDVSCKACTASRGEKPAALRWLNPRIGDFGLVHQFGQGEVPSSQNFPDYRNDAGTAYYQPPRKDERKDEKIDIFALGVVFVEMLCRCNTAMERVNMLKELQNGEVPSNLRHSVQDEGHDSETAGRVVRLVSSMVHQDSDERWSGSRVCEALRDLLSRCEG